MKFGWVLALLLLPAQVFADGTFTQSLGKVTVNPVKTDNGVLKVPFIFWGGDVATFYANGGLSTKPDSIFAKSNLKIDLVQRDDFTLQVKDYLEGKSPFLRCTTGMLGIASEAIGADPRTKPVVFLQLTWSAGDHMVAVDSLKNLNQLKGKRIALQKASPHVGMLDEVLKSVKLDWKDVEIIWTEDITGDKGPAATFANSQKTSKPIDACFAITPDMFGLTGGLESKGSDAEGNVKGSHVLISTATMSRSIADVYVCRKDYYDANKATVTAFTAGYLAATEQIVAMRKEFESNPKSPLSKQYLAVLKMAQTIYGVKNLPTIEVDTHGLIQDATFVGLAGNVSFFRDKGNLSGFEAKQKAALDLGVNEGYASVRTGFFPSDFNYQEIAKLAGIKYSAPTTSGSVIAEGTDVFPDSEQLDDRTILSFDINFAPNEDNFSDEVYGVEFQRVLETASTYGHAKIVIRGHTDPTQTLVDLLTAGTAKGVIQRSGTKGNYQYFFNKEKLDLKNTPSICKLIEAGAFEGTTPNPKDTMLAALNLSQRRAESVKKSIANYATTKGLTFNLTQAHPVGVGIAEPLIAKPKNADEAKQNMRVEFRLIKVPAESIKASDFDF